MTIPEQFSGVLGLGSNLDKKTNPYTPTDDLYDFQGWYLSEAHSISKRRGFQKLNADLLLESALPATFTGLWEYSPSVGSLKQVATTQTALYVYNTPSSNVWNSISLADCGGARTGTVDDLFDSAILFDQMYIGNGKDSNIRFDANAVTPAAWNMGISSVTTACSVTTSSVTGSGMATGDYSYRVTFLNALGHESNPNNTSATVAVVASTSGTNNAVSLSSIPTSGDAQVTARKIYRTTVNGGLHLYLTTIANNTATTYIDSANDSQLTIAIEGFANGVAPKFKMIDIYKGVAFMGGDPDNLSRIWFSGTGKPYAVDSNDYRDLDPNDGDIITGIKKYLTTVVAFKNNSIWNAIGEDRTNFGFERKITTVGSVNNASIVDVPVQNVLAFMSPFARFYFYDGTNATPTAQSIEPVLNGLNLSLLSKTVGCTVPSLNQCRWIVPNGVSNSCDLVIWYDYILNKWGTTELTNTKANTAASMHDTTNKMQYYVGGAYDSNSGTGGGFVWQADTGGTDDGADITCTVTDRGHPRQDPRPENKKAFYHLFVWFKPTANVVFNAYVVLDDPDGTPLYIGQIDASKASGQDHIHFNKRARRLYVRLVETSSYQGQVLRGWRVSYKDVGQHNAP